MIMEELKTKKCSRCGLELPLDSFYRNKQTNDGYCYYCKKCHNEAAKRSKCLKPKSSTEHQQSSSLHKIYANPELAKYQPRELIAELRARGYSGELSVRQTITV
jgi:hypothetical protein